MPERVRGVAVGALTAALAAIVLWGLVTGEPSETDRVEALGARIKCPVCQGESILDSPSGYAQDILAYVEEKVDEGWTDDEIVTHLEERFAGIDLDPGVGGSSLLLWVLPVAAIAAGARLAAGRLGRSDGDA